MSAEARSIVLTGWALQWKSLLYPQHCWWVAYIRHPLNFVPQVTLRTKSGDAGVRTPALQSGAQGLIHNSDRDISEALLSFSWHMLSHILKYVTTAKLTSLTIHDSKSLYIIRCYTTDTDRKAKKWMHVNTCNTIWCNYVTEQCEGLVLAHVNIQKLENRTVQSNLMC